MEQREQSDCRHFCHLVFPRLLSALFIYSCLFFCHFLSSLLVSFCFFTSHLFFLFLHVSSCSFSPLMASSGLIHPCLFYLFSSCFSYLLSPCLISSCHFSSILLFLLSLSALLSFSLHFSSFLSPYLASHLVPCFSSCCLSLSLLSSCHFLTCLLFLLGCSHLFSLFPSLLVSSQLATSHLSFFFFPVLVSDLFSSLRFSSSSLSSCLSFLLIVSSCVLCLFSSHLTSFPLVSSRLVSSCLFSSLLFLRCCSCLRSSRPFSPLLL